MAYTRRYDYTIKEIKTRNGQLDCLETLLDKMESYKDTDASIGFYRQLETLYDRISFDGPIKVSVLEF